MIKLGYVRTSRAEQHPENQVNLILEQGVPKDRVFVDAGVSGTTSALERPGFNQMMKTILENPEEWDGSVVYVFEISRLGRSFLDTLSIVNDLERKGFMVWSLSPLESWTRTENRKLRELMLAIFTWVADRERESLVERTQAGLERARAEGKNLGRPFRDIPWKKVDEYVGQGLTLSGASRLLNIPYSTLWKRNKKRKAD